MRRDTLIWLGAAVLAATLLGPLPAVGQDLSRADPALRFLLMNRASLDAAPRPAPDTAAAPDTPATLSDAVARSLPGLFEPALDRSTDVLRVRVLVRLGPGGEAALLRAGAIIGTRAGDIVTARIPLDAIPGLLAVPAIRSMEAAATLRTLARPRDATLSVNPELTLLPAALDSATDDAGFGSLRTRVGERWEGLAGQGTLIGIYDSGVDLTHDDFLHPDGSSRVIFAWDQSIPGAGPGAVGEQAFDYGVECTGPVIDRGGCPMVDRVGHGTHVAGIAAADGSATGLGQPAWRYPGGAPAADLIVVKGADVEFTADRLVDGVAYIFDRAQALGRPAVVNLSLSSPSGPHDGTTLLERMLDALTGPGRILVTGTGNSGDHRNTVPPIVNGPSHAEATAGETAVVHGVRVPVYEPVPGPNNDGFLLELWYEGADSLTITVRSPGGAHEVTVATGDSATLITPVGAMAIDNAVAGPAPGNGDHGALIGILDAEGAGVPASGLWQIEVRGTGIHEGGRYHLWLLGSTFQSEEQTWLEGRTTNRYLVGVPASADRVLAAGAHVTRHEWLGVGEQPQSFPYREALGDIAFFSSPGPRRDGVSKPDVTAPGKMVISSLSADATFWDPFPSLVEADSVHVALMGTSMAAPQLTAAVALLLQIEPTLTPEQARDALRLGAATDAFVPGRLPDPAWGAGKLDAAGAVERLRPGGLVGEGEAVSLSENPVRSNALTIGYSERPRSLAVYTLIGERVRSFRDGDVGPLTTTWGLDTDAGGAVANGAYVLVVEFSGQRVVRKILVARR